MLSHHNTLNTVTNSSNMESITSHSTGSAYNDLSDKWTLWAHLPHNTDWSINSYIKIFTYSTVEETIAVTETLPSILVETAFISNPEEEAKLTDESYQDKMADALMRGIQKYLVKHPSLRKNPLT